jgi:hypothetical protein
MPHFTLQDLSDFTKNERKMVEGILPLAKSNEDLEPREEILQNILNYSKALSVRKSKKMNSFKMVLN